MASIHAEDAHVNLIHFRNHTSKTAIPTDASKKQVYFAIVKVHWQGKISSIKFVHCDAHVKSIHSKLRQTSTKLHLTHSIAQARKNAHTQGNYLYETLKYASAHYATSMRTSATGKTGISK